LLQNVSKNILEKSDIFPAFGFGPTSGGKALSGRGRQRVIKMGKSEEEHTVAGEFKANFSFGQISLFGPPENGRR